MESDKLSLDNELVDLVNRETRDYWLKRVVTGRLRISSAQEHNILWNRGFSNVLDYMNMTDDVAAGFIDMGVISINSDVLPKDLYRYIAEHEVWELYWTYSLVKGRNIYYVTKKSLDSTRDVFHAYSLLREYLLASKNGDLDKLHEFWQHYYEKRITKFKDSSDKVRQTVTNAWEERQQTYNQLAKPP